MAVLRNGPSTTLLYNIQTNFGCSKLAEYTKSGAELPTSISLPDGTSYSFTYENTVGHSGYTTGRLASVTLATGGSITYTYPTTNSGANNGINCTDGSAPLSGERESQFDTNRKPRWHLDYYRTDVSGNHWQTKITSPPDPLNTGSVGDDTVIDFQQDASTAQYGNTHNLFETQRQVFQGSQSSGTILSQTITCYNTADPTPANCPTASVSTLISRVTAFSYLPNTSGRVSETDTQYNDYSDPAFPSEIDSYDYGTTAGSVGALIRKVSNGWGMFGSTTNPTIVLVGTIVEDGSNNVKSSVSFGYNQFVTTTSGTPQHQIPMGTANANVTSITEQVTGGSSPTYLYRVFTYYDTGMLNTATDWGTTSSGGPNVTTYNYSTASFSQETTTQSCGNSFVTSISEPLSLTRSFTWDCFGGVQTSTTDENGQTSTVYYSQTSGYGTPDPDYWRPYATTDPLNYATTLSHPNNTVGESALLFNSSNSVVDRRIKVDGFGRVILNQMKEGPSLYQLRFDGNGL